MSSTSDTEAKARRYIDAQLRRSREYRDGDVSLTDYETAVRQTVRVLRRYASLAKRTYSIKGISNTTDVRDGDPHSQP